MSTPTSTTPAPINPAPAPSSAPLRKACPVCDGEGVVVARSGADRFGNTIVDNCRHCDGEGWVER